MEKPKDYYELLGVQRDASVATIRRAFRRLSRLHRPERAEATSSALAELQVAYETLTDAERRRRYDDELQGRGSSPLAWSVLRRPAAGDLRRPFTPTSLTAEVVLGADDASKGTFLSLDVPVTLRCDLCNGTGGSLLDCERCGGSGKIGRRLPVPLQVPPRTREGTVFEVRTDDPAVPSILLAVHVRQS